MLVIIMRTLLKVVFCYLLVVDHGENKQRDAAHLAQNDDNNGNCENFNDSKNGDQNHNKYGKLDDDDDDDDDCGGVIMCVRLLFLNLTW